MICAHCGFPLRGLASINDDYLCHPDVGMDCYALVGTYGHPAPCGPCGQLEAHRGRDRAEPGTP